MVVKFRVRVAVPPTGIPSMSLGTPGVGVVEFANSTTGGCRVPAGDCKVEESVTLMKAGAKLLKVKVEVTNEPWATVREAGLAARVNGTTLVEMLVVRARAPLFPVTLME